MGDQIPGGLLGPVIVLNLWTFAIEIWMYATRIPVFMRLKIADDNTLTKSEIDSKTPPSVRWKADNFNHLMEQPTQFYAIALTLALATGGNPNKADVALAWAYVGLRVLHSLSQTIGNKIPVRFSLFVWSSAVLAALAGRTVKYVF